MTPVGETDAAPKWRIDDDAAWTGSAERVIVLALADPDATPIALEGSASAVWETLSTQGPVSTLGISRVLAEDFGVEAEEIVVDVEDLLVDLRARRVVARD